MNLPSIYRRPSIRLRAAILSLAALAALTRCVTETGSKGGQRAAQGLRGTLVDAGGRAVRGARVSALAADMLTRTGGSSSALDSTVTDGAGAYAFRELPAGVYNIQGESREGALAVLVPEVAYTDTVSGLDVGVDTLRLPGSIRGRVVWGGKGREGVIAYLPGTSYLAFSDTDGSFSVSGVPEGRYRVSYLVEGFRAAPDTGVDVRPGSPTTLAPKPLALDSAFPAPPPSGLTASLDTLAGVVRLVWRAVPAPNLLGYSVYRDTGGLAVPVLISARISSDTVFADTLAASIIAGSRDSRRILNYRVRSVDRILASAAFSTPATVGVVPPDRAATALSIEVLGAVGGRVSIGDTVRFAMAFANPTRRIVTIAWHLDGGTEAVRIREAGSGAGTDTLPLAWPSPGTHGIEVRVLDDADRVWIINQGVVVSLDIPTARAGPDTSVSIGDSVRLHGEGFDGLGAVADYAWSLGGGGFRSVPDGTLAFTAPASASADIGLLCILRVTDDDGLIVFDTLRLRVMEDPPIAVARSRPPEAFPGDSIMVSAAGSFDRFGRIVAWEWDIGGTGTFAAVSGRDTVFEAPSGSHPEFACVLRVTDDDGRKSEARITVPVFQRDRWIKRDTNTPMRRMDRFATAVLRDTVWVLGRTRTPVQGRLMELWKTPDMKSWSQVAFDEALDAGLESGQLAVHAGKLWVMGPSARFWCSVDGTAWAQVSSPPEFGIFSELSLAEFAGKLWVVGAQTRDGTHPITGEVWQSADGKSWTLATAKPPFGWRSSPSLFAWGGSLWLAGGHGLTATDPNDLWSTQDGIAWTKVAAKVFSVPRVGFSAVGFAGELWLVGGSESGGAGSDFTPDAWRSRDGKSWARASESLPGFSTYYWAEALAFRDRMWLLASDEDFGQVPRDGIWSAPYLSPEAGR